LVEKKSQLLSENMNKKKTKKLLKTKEYKRKLLSF